MYIYTNVARQHYSICSRVFSNSFLVSGMVHSKSTTILLEGPLLLKWRLHDIGGSFCLSVSCKCAGKQMSPMNWCGFKYFVFHALKGGVHCMVL